MKAVLILEPARGFDALKRSPDFIAPLLAVMAGLAGLLTWYYARLDLEWYVDGVLAQQNVTHDAAQAAAREGITRGKLLAGALAGVFVAMPLARLLEAMYLRMVARVLAAAGNLRAWFSLACWSSLPELLAIPAMAANLHRAPGGRLEPERLDPTTLTALLNLDPTNSWAVIGGVLSLPLLLKVGLLAAGLRSWLATSWPASIAIAAAPYAAVLGAWAALAALKA